MGHELAAVGQEERVGQIADARARRRRLEPPGLRDDPIRQVAAVRRAQDAEPVGVRDPAADELVDAGEDVLVVGLAPRVDDRALARASVGYGSTCPTVCMNCGKRPYVTPPPGPPWQ